MMTPADIVAERPTPPPSTSSDQMETELAEVKRTVEHLTRACWEVRFHYFNPRAAQLDPTIHTPIGLPNFPSYSSGHSTFSAAAASILSYEFPTAADRFSQMKDEAAISRLYGGIHYRSNIENGKVHGHRVATYMLQVAHSDGGH